MDPQVVLARTALGAEALDRQDHDLPRALRHALILIDGRSNVARLEQRGAIIPEFPAALRELVARGLAAPVAGSGPATPASAQPGASPGPTLGRSLVAVAQSVLGASSGKVVKKIEEAGASRDALLAAVDASYKLIRLTIDEAQAEEFRRAARELLTRAG